MKNYLIKLFLLISLGVAQNSDNNRVIFPSEKYNSQLKNSNKNGQGTFTFPILKMDPFMDEVLFMLQVEKGMKVNGNRVKKMEKGHTFILMVTLTMVSGKMI